MDEKLAHDQTELAIIAQEFWQRLETDVDESNALTARSDAVVAEWSKRGSVQLLLTPLLSHPRIEVRYLAAGYLAQTGSDTARRTLEEISQGPYGRISASAALLLGKLFG